MSTHSHSQTVIGCRLRCSVANTFTRGQHVVVNLQQKPAKRCIAPGYLQSYFTVSPMCRQDNGYGLLPSIVSAGSTASSTLSTVGKQAFPVSGACTTAHETTFHTTSHHHSHSRFSDSVSTLETSLFSRSYPDILN